MDQNSFKNLSRKQMEKILVAYGIFAVFLGLIRVGAILFLIISFIVHWFNNDSLTFIQNIKWSLTSYWFLIILAIVSGRLGTYILHNRFKPYKKIWKERLNDPRYK